jgi:hypothetical protein
MPSSVSGLILTVAVVVAGCTTSQEAPEAYAWAPVRPPAVPGAGLPARGQPGQGRPQSLPRSPHQRELPPTREPGLWAGDSPRASQELEPEPEANPTPKRSGSNRGPPAPLTAERRRPECGPIPVPHAGGDDAHNKCADRIKNNSFPGWDVLVNGKQFDALVLATRTLWEVKTDDFDIHSPRSQAFFAKVKLPEIRREAKLAAQCGYNFVVGVKSAAHKAALEKLDKTLTIVVMDWC